MKINQLMEEGLNQELSKENSTEIETISVHNKEVKNMQAEEGFYRASRARGPGIKILSMTAVGSKEIKIGEATMPLLFIRQTSDIDVTVKNYSSQSKNGKVNIYINNDLVKTTSIHVSANQTTTLTVSLSLTGPGIHTLKIAVADLGGSSYHEESKDFYWAAMEGAAAKFEMIAPLNNYNEVGQEASFKVKIRNVGTINIPTLRLKFSEDGQVMLLGNLNLPGGALPPGYSVSFSVVYVAKTEGFHTVEFELDPDRTKLKNILGEDLIER
ncbi:MAG: hypothetical protein N4A64_12350, partial [Marinisporobacter sp.]|nr:hypothetical protein [Marinisporobacter sp.]